MFKILHHFTIVCSIIIVGTIFISAKPISKEIAQKVCVKHYSIVTKTHSDFISSVSDISLIMEKQDQRKQPLFYVFSVKNNGFTIIAGDDRVSPILGYSYTSEENQTSKQFPPQMVKLLEYYETVISDVVSQSEPNYLTTTQKDWEKLLSDKKVEDNFSVTSLVNVPPLIKATWDQGAPYNKFCPRYPNGDQTVVGCVATAMAMIMHYHKYPERGTGFNSFQLQQFGTISANFSNFTYNWSAMPNSISSSSSSSAIDQVARISFHCGVATEMMYDISENNGSGTYSHLVPDALIKYFGYDKDNTKYIEKRHHTDQQWNQLLQNELSNNRPIYYKGTSTGGGHAFIIDGYSGNFFAVNWGWSGSYNGNFLLTNLTPAGTGIGGGAGSFNFNQAAVFIKPPVSGGGTDPSINANLQINTSIVVTPNPIIANGSVTVTTNIVNRATSVFNGSLSVAIFKSTGEFVDFIQIKEDISIPPNNTFTNPITFSKQSLFGVSAGSYLVALYYKTTNGEWQIASKAQFPNIVTVSVINQQFTNVLSLYGGEIEVSPVIKTETPFQVKLNLQNISQFTFHGDYSVDLMNSKGEYIEELSKIKNVSLSSGYVYSNKLTFNVQGLSGIEPGSYYIAAWFKPSNGEWKLVNPGQYTNPKQFTLVPKGISPDVHEPNNEIQFTRSLTLSNNGGCQYTATTNNANLHNSDDLDFYSIVMPSQCQFYNVSITTEDMYESSNYTADVIFSHNFSNEVYDLTPSKFVLASGENLRIRVEPYFPGQTGTYRLIINLTPSSISSVASVPSFWTLSPNPASNLAILSSVANIEFSEVVVHDVVGKILFKVQNQNSATSIPINTSGLLNGQYILEIRTSKNESHKVTLNIVR